MSQNLDKKFRLVQNSHELLSKSLGFGKENLQCAAGIPTVQWSGTIIPPPDNENILHNPALRRKEFVLGNCTALRPLSFWPS